MTEKKTGLKSIDCTATLGLLKKKTKKTGSSIVLPNRNFCQTFKDDNSYRFYALWEVLFFIIITFRQWGKNRKT